MGSVTLICVLERDRSGVEHRALYSKVPEDGELDMLVKERIVANASVTVVKYLIDNYHDYV